MLLIGSKGLWNTHKMNFQKGNTQKIVYTKKKWNFNAEQRMDFGRGFSMEFR